MTDGFDTNFNNRAVYASSRKYFSLVISSPDGKIVKFDVCPFCSAVYIFPKAVLGTALHVCACGAHFNTLGFASINPNKRDLL